MWPQIRRQGSRSARIAPHRQYAPVPPTATDVATTLTVASPSIATRSRWSGLYEGEPIHCQRNLGSFVSVLGHLALMVAVFKVFRVEGPAFFTLAVFALVALPVHYLLPYRWKKPAFVAVSVGAMAWIFDPTTTLAALTVATLLIGICYLPVAWGWRAGMVGAVAAACAAARPGTLVLALPSYVWPVVATMFMFRMVIYLYELKHAKKREPLVDTLSYFFLLPNYAFMHFPVVDYRTFHRGYFAGEVHETMRAGLQMMFRGTTHLLMYRLVYHELLITPEEVEGPVSLFGYLFCNYLLYLRVSGQFHVACGMLHLFGFRMPETHRHFLLASGFTDYWRRINIYWKDFMVRVVFNPVVFRLKRWPQPMALAVATAVVFLATWALHAYQSYWLRGSWGFTLPDALFWGVLGLFVMVNVQLDARRSAARRKKAAAQGVGSRLALWAKTAATLATITVLWALWSSPSVGAWWSMLVRGVTGPWQAPAWASTVALVVPF